MITRADVMATVLQGSAALANGNADLGYLRFLINKSTYQLSQGLLVGDFEADPLTIGWGRSLVEDTAGAI